MNNDNMNKFFPGSIGVGKSIESPNVNTTMINGVPADQYIVKEQLCNPDTLKNFSESDGGLSWKGVKLVPPNSVMEDRAYTDSEMDDLVSELWKTGSN